MSALVVRALKLEDLIKAMDEIKTSLPAGEIAEIANINSVRPNSLFCRDTVALLVPFLTLSFPITLTT